MYAGSQLEYLVVLFLNIWKYDSCLKNSLENVYIDSELYSHNWSNSVEKNIYVQYIYKLYDIWKILVA